MLFSEILRRKRGENLMGIGWDPKIKICIAIIIISILLIVISTKIIVQKPATTGLTVYVATDGSGDYNCDGSDDHVEINQALAFVADNEIYTTVHLNGTNTYWINDTLLIGDDTILEGDSDVCIKLIGEAGWSKAYVPLIANRDPRGNDNIIIQSFEIDGNSEKQRDLGSKRLGNGYYNLIYFEHSNNITVRDMYLNYGCGDGLKVYKSNNVTFTNNRVYKLGHDALYAWYSNNIVAAGNDIFTRTNSAIRLSSSNNAKIYNNNIHSEFTGSSTGPGIQIEKSNVYVVNDIEIYENTIHTLNGAGIFMNSPEEDTIRASDVYIHHNTFYDVGQYWKDTGYSNAAIIIKHWDNTTIENNVIDDGGHAGIKFWKKDNKSQTDETFTAVIRNNIIINHDDHTAAGIWNEDETKYVIISENNCFYNNIGGADVGANIKSSNDIQVDPFFVNPSNHDYHLKSVAGHRYNDGWAFDDETSPLIDAGHPTSDYRNEPGPNGGKINIGRYGNTAEASRSSSD